MAELDNSVYNAVFSLVPAGGWASLFGIARTSVKCTEFRAVSCVTMGILRIFLRLCPGYTGLFGLVPAAIDAVELSEELFREFLDYIRI